MLNPNDHLNIIKVEDYINPKLNSSLFYVVHSTWFKKEKKGILYAEEIDPNSWFKKIKVFDVQQFDKIEDLQKAHLDLSMKLDWRDYKNALDTNN